MYCSWIIESEFDAKILITFHDFDLEWSKTCLPYDYVKVSDMCSKSTTWSENLGSPDIFDGYCGYMMTFTVATRCGKARVEFRSDGFVTGKGFNATYMVIRSMCKLQII